LSLFSSRFSIYPIAKPNPPVNRQLCSVSVESRPSSAASRRPRSGVGLVRRVPHPAHALRSLAAPRLQAFN